MDVRQLEYLLTISREGSLSAAAEIIHISQSALSQSLQKIEKQLGTPLFHRTDKKMIPTEAGRLYLEGAKALVEIKQNTYEKIDDLVHRKKNALSIALCPQVYQHSGQEILARLQDVFGPGNIQFSELSSDVAREYLANDFLDAAVLCHRGKPESLLTIHTLYEEETVLAVPDDMAWEGTAVDPNALRKVPFASIRKDSYMYFLMDSLFSDPAFTAHIDYQVESLQNIRTLVEDGYAAAFVPGKIAQILRDCRIYQWHTRPSYEVALAIPKYTGKKNELLQVQKILTELLKKQSAE